VFFSFVNHIVLTILNMMFCSIMEVEFDIPFLCEKYEKDFGKVISKCTGIISVLSISYNI